MKCPVDGTTLLLAERQDVEIDYCPECRGVWLDRGELDKLLVRDRDHHDEAERDRQRVSANGRRRRPGRRRAGWAISSSSGSEPVRSGRASG
jgi:Zn-finger nucleic acid-binding protein